MKRIPQGKRVRRNGCALFMCAGPFTVLIRKAVLGPAFTPGGQDATMSPVVRPLFTGLLPAPPPGPLVTGVTRENQKPRGAGDRTGVNAGPRPPVGGNARERACEHQKAIR